MWLKLELHVTKKESKYVINFLKPLVENIFGITPQIAYPKLQKAIVLKLNSIEIVRFLILCSLLAGNKIKNEVSIPDWVKSDVNLLKACLRGLIDTDGSIYKLKPHWPNLWQLSFKNNNKKLLKDVHETFVKLGFQPSKIFGNRIVLTRQKEIYKYFKEIGTNNLKYSPVV